MSEPPGKRAKIDVTRPSHNKACARCRMRKIKCDALWPACSSCKSAHVPCMGYDTTLSKEVPRSIVAQFEDKVLALEKRIKCLKEQNEQQEAFSASASIGSNTNFYLRNALTAALTTVMDFDGAESNLYVYYDAFHLQQSSLPLPFPPQTRYLSRDEIDGRPSPQAINLSEVPRAAADLMLKNYTDTLSMRHPCVGTEELLESYAKCFDSPTRASSYDVFIVCMVLAISAATLIWTNEQHALSSSASFFAKAKEMLALPTTYDTEIRQIEVALLLAHYSFMSPTSVDAWYCIGDASRRCINLGLHKEADPGMGLSPHERETRQRLFWTTCGLERTICSQLRLPFLLDESDITTKLYSPPSTGTQSLVQKQLRMDDNDASEFRLLEREVYNMLWIQKPQYDSITLEDWLVSVNARIDDWCLRAQRIELRRKTLYGYKRVFEMSSIGQNLLKGRLYRPTPRVLYPSQESRLEFIKASMAVTSLYTQYCKQHRLIYPWFAAHNLFEMAIATLDTAWLGSDWLPQYVDLQEVICCIHDYPNLLREVALFWPGVRGCADTVTTLAEPVIRRLEAIYRNEEPPARDCTTSNVLAWYLFPDSALTAEQRTVEPNFNEIDISDIEQFQLPMIGMEDFDWAMGEPEQIFLGLDFT
ncbi:fungal-specific transcription factor domain-containing protein [Talaromyces proteolyticus]|uniref:Fungal-specific transcription factor domain-containing protein n=1 Tax=Talaromyces proteolyticus TaxID=1131652 RepID=A0AAD4Q2D9_9EURO|nr:fungal-specific transcription factor domain-containing protein [Talaromyces proteolyticus]KAH8700223.1 fungal-specific transcription factor domain-containing protein [Talaromyces proteolyticus]